MAFLSLQDPVFNVPVMTLGWVWGCNGKEKNQKQKRERGGEGSIAQSCTGVHGSWVHGFMMEGGRENCI